MNREILPLFILDVKKIGEVLKEKISVKDKLELLYNIKRGINNVVAQMEGTHILAISYYEKRKAVIKEDDEIQFFISSVIDSLKESKRLKKNIFARTKGEKIKLVRNPGDGSIQVTNKNTKGKINSLDEIEFDDKDRERLEEIFKAKIEEFKKLRNYIVQEIEIFEQKEKKEDQEKVIAQSGDELIGIDDLIWWKGTEGQLVYLYESLVKNNLIDNSQNDRKYLLLSFHFKNKNGKRFNNKQMGQAAQNLILNKEQKPKKSEIIENIVTETLKKS